MEFRNSIATTGVNIPAKMVEYVLASVPVLMKTWQTAVCAVV